MSVNNTFSCIAAPASSRRSFLIGLGASSVFGSLLLSGCASSHTFDQHSLNALCTDCETDIQILKFFDTQRLHHVSGPLKHILEQAIWVREQHLDFLRTLGTTSQQTTKPNFSTISYDQIIQRIRTSSNNAQNLCLKFTGQNSAIAANISAACATIATAIEQSD